MLKKFLISCLFIFLVACGNNSTQQFYGSDISAANLDASFSLTNHHGERASLDSYKNKVIAVFFGFTNCPDICPTSLQELKYIKQELGQAGNNFQVLFISLDPERDTQEKLSLFIPSFDPTFIGLYGSTNEVDAMANQYKVFHQKVEQGDSYTIDHSSGIYLIDRSGKIRIRHPYGSPVEGIIADIQQLLSESI